MIVVLQLLEGIGLAIAGIGVVVLYFVYQFWHHKYKMRAIEHEHERAKLRFNQSFNQAKTGLLVEATVARANVEWSGDGFKIIHFYPESRPQQPRTQVTEITQENQPLQLMAPGIRQPQQRYLLDQLEENGLQVAPGVRTSDGQPIILSIPDAVHFKLIGSSGFGKSCLAAAILDQAIRTNSPDILQIALLDLEHKTSRLFENSPNVAHFQVGKRVIPAVATNADEVALHLGYLKKELDRRALLGESELQYEPLMLIYVEEMLSLQFEVDEKLLAQMLKDLSVLAVRARKYNMFLLACAQTDYSTPELKTAQKQFRSRMAFAIDTTAARAAGFMSTELIKYSFSHSQRGDGLYVLETPGVASLMLAPVYDVRQKVLALDSRSRDFRPISGGFQDDFTVESEMVEKGSGNNVKPLEKPDFSISEKAQKVAELRQMGWGKAATIEKLWNVKPGGSAAYKQAQAEYEQIIAEGGHGLA